MLCMYLIYSISLKALSHLILHLNIQNQIAAFINTFMGIACYMNVK